MLFNSYVFMFVFLPLVLLSYFLLSKFKMVSLAKVVMIFASLYFYSYIEFKNIYIIIGSMVFNYIMGYVISRKNRKIYLNYRLIR
jgi:alginate O-acetyltransferase complex protein AlgI